MLRDRWKKQPHRRPDESGARQDGTPVILALESLKQEITSLRPGSTE